MVTLRSCRHFATTPQAVFFHYENLTQPTVYWYILRLIRSLEWSGFESC